MKPKNAASNGGENSIANKNCMSISGLLRIDREKKRTGF